MAKHKPAAASADTPADVVELEQRSWLPRHQRGDPQAFTELLAAYQRPIYTYLVRCGVAESARDDLFQEIFLKIHASADAYRPAKPLRPWVFTIAVNTVRNYFRDRRDTSISSENTPDLADPGPPLERQIDSQQTVLWLQQAIPTLPLAQRQVLLLTTVEGLRLQDAADALALPLNTVKTHLRRARLTLHKALAQRETVPGDRHDAV